MKAPLASARNTGRGPAMHEKEMRGIEDEEMRSNSEDKRKETSLRSEPHTFPPSLAQPPVRVRHGSTGIFFVMPKDCIGVRIPRFTVVTLHPAGRSQYVPTATASAR